MPIPECARCAVELTPLGHTVHSHRIESGYCSLIFNHYRCMVCGSLIHTQPGKQLPGRLVQVYETKLQVYMHPTEHTQYEDKYVLQLLPHLAGTMRLHLDKLGFKYHLVDFRRGDDDWGS